MKLFFLGLGAVAILGISGLLVARGGGNRAADTVVANNVSTTDGVQTITITARGGYSPRTTTAQSGVPTKIKFVTQNTFDCSLALVIPSLNYQKYLSSTGEEIVDLPPQSAGSTLKGTCSMGMYHFSIQFK